MPVPSSDGAGPPTVPTFVPTVPTFVPSVLTSAEPSVPCFGPALNLGTVPMTSQAISETVPGPVLGSVLTAVPCFVPAVGVTVLGPVLCPVLADSVAVPGRVLTVVPSSSYAPRGDR
jgi:hypothetical protein